MSSMKNPPTAIRFEAPTNRYRKKRTPTNKARTRRPQNQEKKPISSGIWAYLQLKRTRNITKERVDRDDEILDTDVTMMTLDSANLFHAKQSRVHASICATGRMWHQKIVNIDWDSSHKSIGIEFLKQKWRSNSSPCHHPRCNVSIGNLI